MSLSEFAQILSSRNPQLYKYLEDMQQRAEDEWVHLLKPDHGSHSGLIHLRNVERNADKVIPSEKKKHFSDGEIFLLLAAILLHDLGRIIPDRPRLEIRARWPEGRVNDKKSVEPALKKCAKQIGMAARAWKLDFPEDVRECRLTEDPDSSPEFCPLKNSSTCKDEARKFQEQRTHACRTKALIDRRWANFGLPDEQIAALCGVVTFCHQLDEPPSRDSPKLGVCNGIGECLPLFTQTSLEPYGSIRVPLIAAIVRLADETEDSWTRAIRQHWYEHYLKVGSNELYKAFRRSVADVEFRAEAESVIMHLHCAPNSQPDSGALAKSLRSKVDATREAVKKWSGLLGSAGVRYEHVFVQQEDKLCYDPAQTHVSLAHVLEAARFVDRETLEAYFDRLIRLVRGTRGFSRFRWSSIEGALGEPLDPKKKWIVVRMGAAHQDFRIVPDDDKGEVEIAFSSEKAQEIRTAILGPKEKSHGELLPQDGRS